MIKVGTSGWSYHHWRGVFYPPEVPQRLWLSYYAERFDTVEVNATFYRLQRPETFARWAAEVPDGFSFGLKLSRYITHIRRLSDVADPVATFLESLAPLGDRLGPILVQLPDRFAPDLEALDRFLGLWPADVRLAVEPRDRRWMTDEVTSVLDRYGAALVGSDYPDAETEPAGAFRYVRRHGYSARYGGSYPEGELRRLAGLLVGYRGDAYCYFNNDADGAAPADAARLVRLISEGPPT